jgi:hypothetical protein
MRYTLLAALAAAFAGTGLAGSGPAAQGTDWAANLTAIEACSCPMFCQCYFNTKPAAHASPGEHSHHGSTHFCRANLAYRINKGHFGKTSLDGAKFWVATDLGGDFSKGQLDWGVLYFDKGLTKAQRDAIAVVAGRIFPVQWRSFSTAEASIDTWEITPTGAVALMDGGKTAEVRLRKFQGMTDEPVVIRNLKYWGAPRNDGFIMAPNEVEAYRVGPKAFEFKGTNGFLITIDLTSNDFAS